VGPIGFRPPSGVFRPACADPRAAASRGALGKVSREHFQTYSTPEVTPPRGQDVYVEIIRALDRARNQGPFLGVVADHPSCASGCRLSADSRRSLSREQPTGFDPEPSFATPQHEYFVDGMVEAIITALSRIR
jgi:hypothetical protein